MTIQSMKIPVIRVANILEVTSVGAEASGVSFAHIKLEISLRHSRGEIK